MGEKAWTGRFNRPLDARVEAFNESISFDQRLYREDISGSIAHVTMLASKKIITKKEAKTIKEGLEQLLLDIEAGNVVFSLAAEDIHMNIESMLIDKIGSVAKKMHTARSRNDQVALDMRLYLRKAIKEIVILIDVLLSTLKHLCQTHTNTYMPGYTHLQRAQPVSLAMHLGAYLQMFHRDISRMNDCLQRFNQSPLGAGSLAGSTLPIDRAMVAKELGFNGIVENPMDAVSDRDYLLEFLSGGSILAMHMSRLSEELILWASEEFGFIQLDDGFSTGSSLMPQKKNPDVPELIRGKTGRIYGHLVALLTTMKGLPLAYNKDMQEDKEGTFDAVDTLKNCLQILPPFMESVHFNKKRMLDAAQQSFLCATELVDYLVERNVKFRDAHEIVGRLVHHCVNEKKFLDELDLTVYKTYSAVFNEDLYKYLNLETAVKKRGLSQRFVSH